MEFTSNTILSLLMPYRGRPYFSSRDKRTYRWVSLLPDSDDQLQPDILYVCRLSEAMLRNHRPPDCHYVCICDRYLSDEEREDAQMLRNIIIVEENCTIPWLLELFQKRFLELNRWESELKDVLLRDGDYQQILDVSEHYLKNALFVLDGAYRLIAYSKHYKSTDPVNVALYENGYHSPEVMQKFYDHDRFLEYHMNPGLVFATPGQVSQFECICKWCRYDGVPLVHVVEVFYNRPITAEDPELFETMMKYINICFLKEQKRSHSPSQAYSRFMLDMLYAGLNDTHQLAECARRTSIPFSGSFDAYRIVFRENGKVLVGRFVQELSVYLGSSKIVSKDFEISVFNIYPKPNVSELSQRNLAHIAPLLQRYGAFCGVSAPFTALPDFPHACAQASHALSYGMRGLLPHLPGVPDMYHYKDVCVYLMVHLSSNGSFDVFHNNPYLQKLQNLQEFDQEHNSTLPEILYCFLFLERRATEAGKALHMHRNTVVYHVSHIEDLLGLDFNDYYTRQGTLLAFHYLRLKQDGAFSIPDPRGDPLP